MPRTRDERTPEHGPEKWVPVSLAKREAFARRFSAFGGIADIVSLAAVSTQSRLPSRPGEFHPEPLTDPDWILSHHPARATARRLPPSVEPPGSSRHNQLAQIQRRWPAPFAPRPLQPLHRYYGAVRPSPAHRYFRPCGWSRLCLFPWHRQLGSHVPYKSLVEIRAVYMPDVARSVSGHPPN